MALLGELDCLSMWMLLFCVALPGLQVCGTGVYLRGLGASLPTEVFEAWTPAFENYRQRFIDIDNEYVSTGSGDGKERALEQQTWQENQYIASESLLNESDYTHNPDLRMFPVLAGAVVLGYNILGVPQLNLTKQHIVGIYNGTIRWWNDSTLVEANPEANLPLQPIKVIARTDESGSTEIFTAALCEFSQDWNVTYGRFSEGFDEETEEHDIWEKDVIQLRGRTNRGMSGLILSYRYSIGYVSVADAMVASISYACVLDQGEAVDITQAGLEAAMDASISHMDDKLTADLVRFVRPGEYPIIGFTYFISDMSKTSNCEEAREMVRYVEWMAEDEFPRGEIIDFKMAAITESVAQLVTDRVLMQMTCRGSNLYELVQQQKRDEWLSTQTWRLPVFITAPIVAILILGLIGYIAWQQVKLRRAIASDDWKIPSHSINLKWSKRWGFSGGSEAVSSISLAMSATSNFSFSAARHVNGIGLWNEKTVALRELLAANLNVQRKEIKKALIWMRDKVQHSNVLRFYGMTYIDNECFIVSEHAPKGTLSDVVQNDRYRIDDNIKFSLALDIASGMSFLHKQDITHCNLMSECCFIDHRWNVKIADWEHNKLSCCSHRRTSAQVSPVNTELYEDPNIAAKQSFWVAPEILRSAKNPFTKKCDIYSFAIILLEIFTREDPYCELWEKMEAIEIEEQIRVMGIRPDISTLMPVCLRPIIISAWSEDPHQRPGFGPLKKSLKSLKPSKKSVMDGMMEILEGYVLHLEDKVSERTAELASANQGMKNLLHQILPPSVAEKLYLGESVQPETFETVTIFFSDIVGFTSLSASSSPMEVVSMLNDLYTKFDAVIDKHDVYKVETIGDAYMVISGLPNRNGITHACHIANMAIDLLNTAGCFVMRHKPGEKLQLRAGMHSGPVVAGVVGLKMPRYCLFGDTVNTASRMESTSLPMRAQVSETTATLLHQTGGFTLEERGSINVKGKGQMKTYFLQCRHANSTQEGVTCSNKTTHCD